GQPMDPFGNPVDSGGESVDPTGRVIDPVSFLLGQEDRICADEQRDREYTLELGERLARAYRELAVLLPTHLVARVLFDRLAAAAVLLPEPHGSSGGAGGVARLLAPRDRCGYPRWTMRSLLIFWLCCGMALAATPDLPFAAHNAYPDHGHGEEKLPTALGEGF